MVENASQVKREWYTSRKGNLTTTAIVDGWKIRCTIFRSQYNDKFKYIAACDGWKYASRGNYKSVENAQKAAERDLRKYGPGRAVACITMPWPSKNELWERENRRRAMGRVGK